MLTAARKLVWGETPEEQLRSFKASNRKAQRVLERDVRTLQFEKAKAEREIKQAAKDMERDPKMTDVAKARIISIGRERQNMKKQLLRLNTTVAYLNSISIKASNQLSVQGIVSKMEQTTSVMQTVRTLMNRPGHSLPDSMAIVEGLSKEMMRMEVREEMVDDDMANIMDPMAEEDENLDVQAILDDVLKSKSSSIQQQQIPAQVKLPSAPTSQAEEVEEEEEELEDDEELTRRMAARLEGLRS